MSEEALYEGREQTLVKHYVLEKYLERFALIVGRFASSISYVDCFAGPWKSRAEDFADTSFSKAVAMLAGARDTLALDGKSVGIRCLFLERNKTAFKQLTAFSESAEKTGIEVRLVNAAFEDSLEEISRFVSNGAKTFAFFFVDPTGWTGVGIRTLRPLLKIHPAEFLVNLMTGHAKRFVGSSDQTIRHSFEELFDGEEPIDRILENDGPAREEAIVLEYASALGKAGGFRFVGIGIVLHPSIDKTHFHLVYATRNAKGLDVFKDAEKRAMQEMEDARASAKQRTRQVQSGQIEMFSGSEIDRHSYYSDLRGHYLRRAKSSVESNLVGGQPVPYDELWAAALRFPLVWESDLKEWCGGWEKQRAIAVNGRKPKERSLKYGAGHTLETTPLFRLSS